MKSQRISES